MEETVDALKEMKVLCRKICHISDNKNKRKNVEN